MAVRNKIENETTDGSSAVFPLTAKFNFDSRTHYKTVLGVEQSSREGEKTLLTIQGLTQDYYHNEYATIRVCEVDGDVNEIFMECAAAKAEQRYADLTKFDKPAGP